MRSHSSCLFHTGQSLLVDSGLFAPTRLVFFDIGQPLLVDIDFCASTRLVFFTLVSRCWWTLVCALPLVLSFFLTLVSRCWRNVTCALPLFLSCSHWSAAVGGLWFVRFQSSCLCDTGQSLLVDFGLCAPTRLFLLSSNSVESLTIIYS